MNMFVFGIYECHDGKMHMSILRNFLEQKPGETPNREGVVYSHRYVFGCDKHPRVNYYNLLGKIISNMSEHQSEKNIKAVSPLPNSDVSSEMNTPVLQSALLSAPCSPKSLCPKQSPELQSYPLSSQNIDCSDFAQSGSQTHTEFPQSQAVVDFSQSSNESTSVSKEIVEASISCLSSKHQNVGTSCTYPIGLIQSSEHFELCRKEFENIPKNIHPGLRISIITKRLVKKNEYCTKRIIMDKPDSFVCKFLNKEMTELQLVNTKFDSMFLRQQLTKYNKVTDKKTLILEFLFEQCYWFRIFNMFIFGLHELGVGKMHMKVLKDFLEQKKDLTPLRKSVLFSYMYIFGPEKHRHVGYYSLMDRIINNMGECQSEETSCLLDDSQKNLHTSNILSSEMGTTTATHSFASPSLDSASQKDLSPTNVHSTENIVLENQASFTQGECPNKFSPKEDISRNSNLQNIPLSKEGALGLSQNTCTTSQNLSSTLLGLTQDSEKECAGFGNTLRHYPPHIRMAMMTDRILEQEQRKFEGVIMKESNAVVSEFIKKEMAELQILNNKINPLLLRQQLKQYNKLKVYKQRLIEKICRERCRLFKTTNMFIFGLHEYDVGRMHMKVLKNFLEQKGEIPTRADVLCSYRYIFGSASHPRVNYHNVFGAVINNMTNYQKGISRTPDPLPQSELPQNMFNASQSQSTIVSSQSLEELASVSSAAVETSNSCLSSEHENAKQNTADPTGSMHTNENTSLHKEFEGTPKNLHPGFRIPVMTKCMVKKDQHRIRSTIMEKSEKCVRTFLNKEMAELQTLNGKFDPLFLHQQLIKFNNITREEAGTIEAFDEKYYWFRIFNMFIFGLHQLAAGKTHMKILKDFLEQNETEKTVRKKLFKSHRYIFGTDKHPATSYCNLMGKIIKNIAPLSKKSRRNLRSPEASTSFSQNDDLLSFASNHPKDVCQNQFNSKENCTLTLQNAAYEHQVSVQSEFPSKEILHSQNIHASKHTLDSQTPQPVSSQSLKESSSVKHDTVVAFNSYLPFEQQKLEEQAGLFQTDKNFEKECTGLDDSLKNYPPHLRIAIMTEQIVEKNQCEVKGVIMRESYTVASEFIEREVAKLQTLISRLDPKMLKRQLVKYNKFKGKKEHVTENFLREKCYWFQRLNMFIFGLHECDLGRSHMKVFKDFLELKEDERPTRMHVLHSYNYIFGCDKHPGVCYFSLMDKIIEKSNRN